MITTIQSQTVNGYKGGGSSAILRFSADQDFVTSDGEVVKAGTKDLFYRDIACAVVGTVLSLPVITTIPTTTDSPSDPSATWSARIRNYLGRDYESWQAGFKLPHTVVNPTWADIVAYNNPPGPQPGDFGISYNQAALMISQAIGSLNKASVGVLGRIETDVAPTDANHPKAVVTNSPLVPKAVGSDVLVAAAVTTIPSTLVAANSPIRLVAASDGITGRLYPSNRVVGVSFDVASENGADAGAFRWELF